MQQLADERVDAQPSLVAAEVRADVRQGAQQGALQRLHHLGVEGLGRQLRVDQLLGEQQQPEASGAVRHQRCHERGGEGLDEEVEGGVLARMRQGGVQGVEPVLAHGAQTAQEDLAVEVRLAAEVVVDRGDVAGRLAGDVAHRGGAETLLGEEPLGGVEQALAGVGALGVGDGGTVRHGGRLLGQEWMKRQIKTLVRRRVKPARAPRGPRAGLEALQELRSRGRRWCRVASGRRCLPRCRRCAPRRSPCRGASESPRHR